MSGHEQVVLKPEGEQQIAYQLSRFDQGEFPGGPPGTGHPTETLLIEGQ